MTQILLVDLTVAIINVVLYVVEYVKNDGTRRTRRQATPRSHVPDMFEPNYGRHA